MAQSHVEHELGGLEVVLERVAGLLPDAQHLDPPREVEPVPTACPEPPAIREGLGHFFAQGEEDLGVSPQIQEIVGPGVRVIDPAPAIARQVGRLLEKFDLRVEDERVGNVTLLTTGDVEKLEDFVDQVNLVNSNFTINEISWDEVSGGLV